MNYFLNTHDFFPISCSHSKLQYIFFRKLSERYFIVKKNKNLAPTMYRFYNLFLFYNWFCYFINLNTGVAVLNIIAQAWGLTKLIFMGWKTRNPMSSPIPEHENSRFWLSRDKFVIVEAVLNVIVQATTFVKIFFST